MKETLKAGDAVLVTWLDSSEDYGWKNRSADHVVPGVVVSVGFVVASNDSALVLSHSQGCDAAGVRGTLSAVTVPWLAVVQCNVLELPEHPAARNTLAAG